MMLAATVFWNGNLVSVEDSVMRDLHLSPGQDVAWGTVGEIIEGNARALADAIDKRRGAGIDAPATTELRRLLGQ